MKGRFHNLTISIPEGRYVWGAKGYRLPNVFAGKTHRWPRCFVKRARKWDLKVGRVWVFYKSVEVIEKLLPLIR